MPNRVMETRDLWKVYRNEGNTVPILKGINLDIRDGEFLLVRGVSGSGKSTLLKLMGLLDLPTTGNILIDDMNVTSLSQTDRARIRNRKIGFVFQTFNLIPELTVYENVRLPTWIRGITNDKSKEDALTLIRTVGLEDIMQNYANQLSGGQMQRVAIARALVNNPRIVLADEPTGNLDSKNAIHVMELFKRLNMENGQTFVIVSHNPKHDKDADRIVYLDDGRIGDI